MHAFISFIFAQSGNKRSWQMGHIYPLLKSLHQMRSRLFPRIHCWHELVSWCIFYTCAYQLVHLWLDTWEHSMFAHIFLWSLWFFTQQRTPNFSRGNSRFSCVDTNLSKHRIQTFITHFAWFFLCFLAQNFFTLGKDFPHLTSLILLFIPKSYNLWLLFYCLYKGPIIY